MNLDAIKSSISTSDREVEFCPGGIATGWFFKLRHESSPEVQRVMKRFNSKVRNVALKRKSSQYEQIMAEHEESLRVAHVASWRWADGDDAEQGRPEFTVQNLKDMMRDPDVGYHLKQFIDEEVASLEDFLETSASS